MGQSSDVESALVQMVYLAVSGRGKSMAALARSILPRLAKRRPDLKEQTSKILALVSEASPTRMNEPPPVPVDTDSRLELLRIETRPDIGPQPVWPAAVASVLEAVVAERQRQMELRTLGLSPTRSLLFVGPPGVGKTLSARWLAVELQRPLMTLDLTAVMSSFLGRTGNNIRVVLDYAQQTPSVLLLDEFDAIAKRRDDMTEIGELKRLVTVLLQEVDEWPSEGLLIAATNHPELLDPAVWRRFDQVVEFPLPNRLEIRELLRNLSDEKIGDQELDVFSAVFKGQSFSDISRILARAKRRAFLEDQDLVPVLGRVGAQLSHGLPKSERLAFANYLSTCGVSQREVSTLTGFSRSTLRKYGIAIQESKEE